MDDDVDDHNETYNVCVMTCPWVLRPRGQMGYWTCLSAVVSRVVPLGAIAFAPDNVPVVVA